MDAIVMNEKSPDFSFITIASIWHLPPDV